MPAPLACLGHHGAAATEKFSAEAISPTLMVLAGVGKCARGAGALVLWANAGWRVKQIVLALLLALCGCAKSDIDTHRDVTSRLIAQRGAPDFVDASTAEYAAVQHAPSGMICVIPAEGVFEFDVFPATALNAGAQCSIAEGEIVEAWVAVHFSAATDLDTAFAQAVAQLTNGLEVQPWSGRPSEADRSSPQGLPHYRIARHEAGFGEEQRYLRLSMGEADGWYVQQIVSAPMSDAVETEARVGETWRRGLRAFAAARAAATESGAQRE